jgi:rod shape-determining protein MreD
MARNLWWAVVVVAAALIQTTWLDAIQFQGVLPDLTLLLVVYFAISEGEERAMLTAVLGGIYQDVASNAVLGHHVLCLVIVGFMVGRIARRLVLDHPVVKVGLVMMGSLAHGFLYTVIEYVQTPGKSAIHMLMTNVVPGAFYTALFTPLVFFLLARSFSRHEPSQGGAA